MKIQNCPYPPPTKPYGQTNQEPTPTDTSPPLDSQNKKRVQQIVGSILYYARAVDMTVLMALSTIAAEQANATKKMLNAVEQ